MTPAQWTSPIFNSLRVYASDRWTECNAFFHGAILLLASSYLQAGLLPVLHKSVAICIMSKFFKVIHDYFFT